MKRILVIITFAAIVPMFSVVMLVIIANKYDPEGIGAGVFYNAPIILIILAVLGAIVSDKLTRPKN